MILSIKYNEDYYFGNQHYAAIGGITLQELNSLEQTMLTLIDHQLYVPSDLYNKYLEEIMMLAEEIRLNDNEKLGEKEELKENGRMTDEGTLEN